MIDDIARWAAGDKGVRAVAVVGSYARSAQRMGSDVDIVILADDPGRLADSAWFQRLRQGARLIRSTEWGPVLERRMRLPSGLHVELDLAPTSWAAVPLDAGTRRVLGDGYRIVYDTGVLAPAVHALLREGP